MKSIKLIKVTSSIFDNVKKGEVLLNTCFSTINAKWICGSQYEVFTIMDIYTNLIIFTPNKGLLYYSTYSYNENNIYGFCMPEHTIILNKKIEPK